MPLSPSTNAVFFFFLLLPKAALKEYSMVIAFFSQQLPYAEDVNIPL